MTGKADQFETDVLALILTAVALATVFQNHVTAPITNIQMALHTADPVEADSQLTNEAAYTSYVRAAVARTAGGWSVASGSASPVANIDFAAATGGSETETHASAGRLATGAGQIFYSGAVTPNIVVSNGVTPRLTTASTITEA